MKKLFVCSLLFFLASYACGQQKSLLWEISGNGLSAPSYLYGTMHSKDSRAHQFGDSVMAKFNSSDVIALENIDLADQNEMEVMKMAMMENTKLSDLLSEKDYEFVKGEIMSKMGFLGMLHNSMKPIVTSTMITELFSVQEMPYTVDEYFQQEAVSRNKKLMGFETFEETKVILDNIPLEDQAQMLLEFLQEYEENMAIMDSLIKYYNEEDLTKLHGLYEDNPLATSMDNELLIKRNQNFVDEMEEIMRKERLFTAVGALHLPGKDGLIALLKQKGYILKPVVSEYNPQLNFFEDDREWYIYADDSAGMSASFPDDPYFDNVSIGNAEGDSLLMLKYYMEDDTFGLVYSAYVGKYDERFGDINQLVGQFVTTKKWKIVNKRSFTNRVPITEIETYNLPGRNTIIRKWVRDDKIYIASIEGSREKLHSNLAVDYFNFFMEQNEPYLLELVGEIFLRNDESSKKDVSEIKITALISNMQTSSFAKDELYSGDTLIYDLRLSSQYNISFEAEGFATKQLIIDSRNIPENSDIYVHGASFYYQLYLEPSNNGKTEPSVVRLIYDESTDYFRSEKAEE